MNAMQRSFTSLLGSSFDDPKTMATLALAQNLLAGRGNTMTRLVGGAGAYGATMQDAKAQAAAAEDRKLRRVMQQMQLQQLLDQQKRQAGVEDAYRQSMETPAQQALAGGGGPTVANAQAMQGMSPRINQNRLVSLMMGVDPIAAAKMLTPEPAEMMSVSPGSVVIDKKTGKQVFAAPAKEGESPEIVRLQRLRDSMPPTSPQRAELDQFIKSKINPRPLVSVTMNEGQKGFDNESKLRGDFKSEPIYKEFQDTQSAYKQIKRALDQGTPIGDTAAATKIMKLLDPGSVVRESELAMAMAATGKLDRLKNYVQMQISGNKLTPQQRIEFGVLADEFYNAAQQAFNSKRSEYEQLGKDYGLNTNRALGPAPARVIDFNDLR